MSPRASRFSQAHGQSPQSAADGHRVEKSLAVSQSFAWADRRFGNWVSEVCSDARHCACCFDKRRKRAIIRTGRRWSRDSAALVLPGVKAYAKHDPQKLQWLQVPRPDVNGASSNRAGGRLEELNELRDKRLITHEENSQKGREILREL